MSVGMSLLAILDDGPTYGLNLKNEFDARTGGIWTLNVGQVYTTLGRLQRDGLVTVRGEGQPESQKVYDITDAGRTRLREWFTHPVEPGAPARDEIVLKLVMATRGRSSAANVIQRERKAAIQLLQDYTHLKRDTPGEGDLGWLFLLDSLIFQTEAKVRWLDACEARIAAAPRATPPRRPTTEPVAESEDVSA